MREDGRSGDSPPTPRAGAWIGRPHTRRMDWQGTGGPRYGSHPAMDSTRDSIARALGDTRRAVSGCHRGTGPHATPTHLRPHHGPHATPEGVEGVAVAGRAGGSEIWVPFRPQSRAIPKGALPRGLCQPGLRKRACPWPSLCGQVVPEEGAAGRPRLAGDHHSVGVPVPRAGAANGAGNRAPFFSRGGAAARPGGSPLAMCTDSTSRTRTSRSPAAVCTAYRNGSHARQEPTGQVAGRWNQAAGGRGHLPYGAAQRKGHPL